MNNKQRLIEESLKSKLARVAGGEDVELTAEEAALFDVPGADQFAESDIQIESEGEDG